MEIEIVNLLFGRSWAQRIVVIGAILIYAGLILYRPAKAKEGAIKGLKTFSGIFTLIVAAVLIGGALEVMISKQWIAGVLGSEAGIRSVFSGTFLGVLMPGGPYVVFPIASTLYAKGAGIAGLVALIVGWSTLGASKWVYGIAFLDSKLVGLTILFSLPAPIIAGLLAHYLV